MDNVRELNELEQEFNLQIKRLNKLSNKLELEKQALSKKTKQLEESNIKHENERIQELNSKLQQLREEKEELEIEYFEKKQDKNRYFYELERIFEKISNCQNSIEYYEKNLNAIEKDKQVDIDQLKDNIKKLEIEKNIHLN